MTSPTTAPAEKDHSVVAVYETHVEAEAAIKQLQRDGIDMKRLSIVGKGFHTEERAVGFYTSGDRMQFWAGQGALWGTLWGMLFGNAFFMLPLFGPLVVMGPLVGWIAGGLEGAAIGGAGGVLAAALTSIGIPTDSVVKYEVDLKAGKYLVLARGSSAFVTEARAMLGRTSPVQVADYGHPDSVLPWGDGAESVDPQIVKSMQPTEMSTIASVPPAAPAADDDTRTDSNRTDYIRRDLLLGLLSEAEIARVSNVEGEAALSDGDEYLDLERLDQGVMRIPGIRVPMGRVLPRKAMGEPTWHRMLILLKQPVSAEAAAAAP
jgi:uncharacterized membrane protein